MLLEIKVTVFMLIIMVTGISCGLTSVSGTVLNVSHTLSYIQTPLWAVLFMVTSGYNLILQVRKLGFCNR